MHPRSLLTLACLAMAPWALAPAPAGAAAPAAQVAEPDSQIPPVPATPAPIQKLLLARPFTLESSFEFDWNKERTPVRSGWLLVLQVSPDLAFPRQVAEPVLFVGAQTAERLNLGHPSGMLVVIVPQAAEAAGAAAPEWADAPIFFGSPRLPEEVTAEIAAQELAAAKAAGIAPPDAAELARALAVGGASLRVQDRAELLKVAAPLVRQYAPDEPERADLLEGKPLQGTATGSN